MKYYLFRIILIVLLGGIISQSSVNAQKVYSVAENGKLIKAPQARFNGSFLFGMWRKLAIPSNLTPTIVTPTKIYIQFDNSVESEFNEDEWLVTTVALVGRFANGAIVKPSSNKAAKNFFKKCKKTRIDKNILEISLEGKFKLPTPLTSEEIEEYRDKKNYIGDRPEFVLCYVPSKQSKKLGKTEKAWIFKQSDYISEEDLHFGENDVLASINDLNTSKHTDIQICESLVPPTDPTYPVLAQNPVQYVVVTQPLPVNQPTVDSLASDQSKIDAPKDVNQPISELEKDIPYSAKQATNTFALIIANEDYKKVSSVPFAKSDGSVVRQYMIRSLGIPEKNIAYVENATLNDMRYEINRLNEISQAYAGEASFIVYYCGHGIPDEKTQNGYLLPIDGYGTDVSSAYAIDDFYEAIGNLEAKQNIVVMDACFSGANKSGEMLVSSRGIAIKAKSGKPKGNLIAISACQGDETAYPYKEKGHGLLTYFFLKKIQETRGNLTLGELGNYIIENVSRTAIVVNGKSQTPSIDVSDQISDDWRMKQLVTD